MALGPPDRQNNRYLNIPSNLGYFRPRSGDMFELYCNLSASALRQPITWTKDDTVLPRARNQRVLVFPSISEEDGGYYSCKAGNAEYNALVDVKPRSVQGKEHAFFLTFTTFYKSSTVTGLFIFSLIL